MKYKNKLNLLLARLQVQGQEMYEESLRQNVKEKKPSYNEWEREVIISLVEDYFKQSGKAGGQKTKQTQHPDYYKEIGRIGGLKKKKRGEKI